MKPTFAVTVVLTSLFVSCSEMESAPHLARLEVRLSPVGPALARDTVRARLVGLDQFEAPYPIGPVTWGVLDSAIATIDGTGLVRTLVIGSTTIVGRADGLSASLALTVAGTRHEGTIGSSELWTAGASPHVIVGRVTVGAVGGVVLTVETGATVAFEPHAALEVGSSGPATLNVPGPGATTFTGRLATPGSWFGLSFLGSGQSTLRNVTLRHCGEAQVWTGCVVLRDSAGAAPTLLIDNVTVRDSRNGAVYLEGNARFAPGSRQLSVLDVRGHVATLRARAAASFPLGGLISGVDTAEIRVFGDTVAESGSWGPIGARWRVFGSVWIEGALGPTLTLRPGTFSFALGAALRVGQGAPGGLRVVGVAPDSQVVLEPFTGDIWDGIHFGPAMLPSALHVVLLMGGRGGEAPYGEAAVFLIGDFAGGGPAPVFDTVRIVGAQSAGVIAIGGGRFGAGSRNLVITGSGTPMVLDPNVASSIPSGSYTGNQNDAFELYNSEITTSQTWLSHSVPYSVASEVVVEGAATPILTLEAGTVVRFRDGGRLRIGALQPGGLRALGSVVAPVRFTAAALPPQAGSWKGIVIGSLADSSTLVQFSTIEFAGAPDDPPDGAIRVAQDIGEIIRNVLVRQSAACGILRGSGSPWTTDFTAPQLANQFENNVGGSQCGP